MVAEDLHGCEDTCQRNSPKISAPVAQCHSCYGRRNKAKRQEFPDMSGLYYNEIVAAECPKHSPKRRHPHFEVEGTKHYIEAQKHHENVSCHVWQSKSVESSQGGQPVGTWITGAHLISRHSTEEGIGPPCALASMRSPVLFHLDAATHGSIVVMSGQYESFPDRCLKIEQTDSHEEKDGYGIWQ